MPPFQAVPACSCGTITDGTHGEPKMSCSPARVTPPAVTWLAPRACSSEPLPFEAGKPCVWLVGRTPSAPARLSKPAPTRLGLLTEMRTALEVSAFLTWSGVRLGLTLS